MRRSCWVVTLRAQIWYISSMHSSCSCHRTLATFSTPCLWCFELTDALGPCRSVRSSDLCSLFLPSYTSHPHAQLQSTESSEQVLSSAPAFSRSMYTDRTPGCA
ncbi:hypothetical protein FA95DRAFT_1201787 [Auriscalpium vulgare]|uniref:Uncharacterized protein n=1 Tax=Auriscalpium vulgare TaxID=40419 RepID=A0ACB8R4L8_9AGAM|nr:hypothetical protein FA95DRAFT_1201787 [Auriscalpium vulgare]